MKNTQIRALKMLLQEKEENILQLQSQLDKFQSIFSAWRPGQLSSHFSKEDDSSNIREPKKQRAQGISAEPHRDITNHHFSLYPKDERYVFSFFLVKTFSLIPIVAQDLWLN